MWHDVCGLCRDHIANVATRAYCVTRCLGSVLPLHKILHVLCDGRASALCRNRTKKSGFWAFLRLGKAKKGRGTRYTGVTAAANSHEYSAQFFPTYTLFRNVSFFLREEHEGEEQKSFSSASFLPLLSPPPPTAKSFAFFRLCFSLFEFEY